MESLDIQSIIDRMVAENKQLNEDVTGYRNQLESARKQLSEYRVTLTSRYNAINELKGVIKVMAKEF